MGFEQRCVADRMEIAYRGSLTAETVGDFRVLADTALASDAREVSLKLHALDALDSSGVGAIVFLHRRLAVAGRRFSIDGLRGQPLALARLIRLDAALGCELARIEPPRRLRLPRLGRLFSISAPRAVGA